VRGFDFCTGPFRWPHRKSMGEKPGDLGGHKPLEIKSGNLGGHNPL
jgi:hypothetical protein